MHTFTVWAPAAEKIEVQINRERIPLEKGRGHGWWVAAVEPAGPGTDYSFVVDGQQPPYPDPRSGWQPNGVHGASRLVDFSAFHWSDTGWQAPPLASAVLYELHIGTFTPEGSFASAEGRLGYLKDLGITHIELMPVASFAGSRGWGYDGVDLYAPCSQYGGPQGLQHFVNACHAHGLAVLLDVVYNHLGPAGNYLAKFGPYFTDAHSTPWGAAVNLEQSGSDQVRHFFIDNALMWLRDYHIDGLRLDAVHALVDRSATHFLEQLGSEVHRLEAELGKSFVVIAETDLNDPRLATAREAGGYGLDAQWSDDFHHALFSILTGEKNGYYADFGYAAALAKSLEDVYVYSGGYSRYRQRLQGRPVGLLPRHRFLGYIQNHDQVGNRARGERLTHLVSPGRARIAAAIVLTSPFIPMLFQGEEFGASSPFQYFTGFENKELGRLVSEGRKKEFEQFGWKPEEVPDPQEEETFLRSKLLWTEKDQAPHSELLAWYRELIRLRRSEPALLDDRPGATRGFFDEGRQQFVMTRGSEESGQQIAVICNFGETAQSLHAGSGSGLLLGSDASVRLVDGRIELGPDSVAIVRRVR